MKLKKEFSEFYSTIRIDSESKVLQDKREVLQDDIKENLPDELKKNDIDIVKSDIRMIDQGSYKYNTTIKSKVVDRDVAVIIPVDSTNDLDPRKIKEDLEAAIKIESRTVTIKEPCVRVSYYDDGEEYLHIDLPLYAKVGITHYLARGKRGSENYSWEPADPDGLNDYLCNKINGNDQLRRIICFIKKWKNEKYDNSTRDHEIPPSIGLTLLACEHYSKQTSDDGDDDLLSFQKTMNNIMNQFSVARDVDGNVTYANITCYLPVTPYADVFNKMRESSSDYMITFYKKLSKAVDNLTDAVNVESAHDAGESVQKVLGNEFSVPAKEAVAAAAQNRREHSFG